MDQIRTVGSTVSWLLSCCYYNFHSLFLDCLFNNCYYYYSNNKSVNKQITFFPREPNKQKMLSGFLFRCSQAPGLGWWHRPRHRMNEWTNFVSKTNKNDHQQKWQNWGIDVMIIKQKWSWTVFNNGINYSSSIFPFILSVHFFNFLWFNVLSVDQNDHRTNKNMNGNMEDQSGTNEWMNDHT